MPRRTTWINLTNTNGLHCATVTKNYLACLGKWNEVTYAVGGGNLTRALGPGAGTPMVVGIVNLQAQYGIAAANVPSIQPNFNQVMHG